MDKHWQPGISIANLKLREKIIRQIREFFYARGVLEVETPLMCEATVTDPYIHSFKVEDEFYLQTSPEYAMKRLLVAGSGSIFQLCKAFRKEESGRYHLREFLMLEWYRIGFDHHQLMDEVSELLHLVLGDLNEKRFSYAELFQTFLSINPHRASLPELQAVVQRELADRIDPNLLETCDLCLQFLMSDVIEPRFADMGIVFVYDYPTTQAALARIRDEDPPVAERCEVYVHGIELGNGFHELANAGEQRKRFERDLNARRAISVEQTPIDEKLLAALECGLPNCAGIAIGVDRLVMLALGIAHITEAVF